MNSEWLALISFVLITTLTPGPNNITSASMGVLYGYKKALRYLLGIAVGFFLVMLLCSMVSTVLLAAFPAFEKFLRWIGAAYILWLAYETLQASYTFKENRQLRPGFAKGFFLQILNPKVIVYGLTLYSTFLVAKIAVPLARLFSALALAATAFCAISIWTAFGASIRSYLQHPKVRILINTVLALLLVYTAFEISGLLAK
jgi:cysteine/O-acetylserine efflux protein